LTLSRSCVGNNETNFILMQNNLPHYLLRRYERVHREQAVKRQSLKAWQADREELGQQPKEESTVNFIDPSESPIFNVEIITEISITVYARHAA
jgi:hypothetical protein